MDTLSVNPGDEFDWLVAREPIGGGKFWLCDCKCGKTTKASKWHLLKGRRRSCCRGHTKDELVTCEKCNTPKNRNEFYIRPNGNLFSRKCIECVRKRSSHTGKLRRHNLKMTALRRYGGDPPVCACCKEPRIEFLHLDHVGGGGNKHRKDLKTRSIYCWLQQQGYPDLPLRVLCANCNLSIGHYGYCPHQFTQQLSTPHPTQPPLNHLPPPLL